jgi:prophage regulatory protein
MSSPKNRRILRLPQTIAKSGLGRDSIYRLGHQGLFPRPIKLSERASGWLEDEVDAWLEERAAERDAVAVTAPPGAGTAGKPPGRARPTQQKRPQRAAGAAA